MYIIFVHYKLAFNYSQNSTYLLLSLNTQCTWLSQRTGSRSKKILTLEKVTLINGFDPLTNFFFCRHLLANMSIFKRLYSNMSIFQHVYILTCLYSNMYIYMFMFQHVYIFKHVYVPTSLYSNIIQPILTFILCFIRNFIF